MSRFDETPPSDGEQLREYADRLLAVEEPKLSTPHCKVRLFVARMELAGMRYRLLKGLAAR